VGEEPQMAAKSPLPGILYSSFLFNDVEERSFFFSCSSGRLWLLQHSAA
jgi:hypothetical protein